MHIIKCECGAEIGCEVEYIGLTFFQVGGMLARSAHGVCSQCKKEFHWTTSDVLMRRVLRLEKKEEHPIS